MESGTSRASGVDSVVWLESKSSGEAKALKWRELKEMEKGDFRLWWGFWAFEGQQKERKGELGFEDREELRTGSMGRVADKEEIAIRSNGKGSQSSSSLKTSKEGVYGLRQLEWALSFYPNENWYMRRREWVKNHKPRIVWLEIFSRYF